MMPKRNDESISNELLELLNLINKLGFVTIGQLDMLWSIINQKPKKFSKYVLDRITKRGSLIKSIPKKTSPIHKTTYILRPNGEKALTIKGVSIKQSSINYHNEQVIDVIVQAMFAASFKPFIFNDSDIVTRDTADRDSTMSVEDDFEDFNAPITYDLEDLLSDSGIGSQRINHNQANNNYESYDKPYFNLADYSLNEFEKDDTLPFWPDAVISRKLANNTERRIFIEMDNLTEKQSVQVNKILNYLWYAANHPNERISLIYVVSDGSVQRSQKDSFKNRYKKLSLLADKLLASYIVDDKGQRHYLTDLYMDLHNIDISLTAESEAYIDMAQVLCESSYYNDRQNTISEFVNYINQGNGWKAEYIHDNMDQHIEKKSEAELLKSESGLGVIRFTYGLERTIDQPVIAGQEHDLGTIVLTHNLIHKALKNPDEYNYPIVIYPRRERKLTAITLSEYKNLNFSNQFYSYKQPLLVQPLWTINNDPQLEMELRWLIDNYAKSVHSYFANGYLSKQTAKENLTDSIPLPVNDRKHIRPRTYPELHELAQRTEDAEQFVAQLGINEVPFDVYSKLFNRGPSKAFCLPIIFDLPFLKNLEREADQYHIAANLPLSECLFNLDNIKPTRRTIPKML